MNNPVLKFNPKKRPKSPEDIFFKQGDEEFNRIWNNKYYCIENDNFEDDSDGNYIKCNLLPSCLNLKFYTTEDYEAHYSLTHRYYCSICNVTLMTERLLNIHLQEVHDSFFEVLSQRKNMYQCLIADCEEKFKDAEERKIHLMEKHNFSKLTNINNLIKKRMKKTNTTNNSNKLWNSWRETDNTYGEEGVWDINYDDEYYDEYYDEYEEDDYDSSENKEYYNEKYNEEDTMNIDELKKKVDTISM
eukprot:jgi/Orpsp1_1/1183064/evm.model.c7180000083695.2